MNETTSSSDGGGGRGPIRLQPVEWLEEMPFQVNIKRKLPRPASSWPGGSPGYDHPQYRILDCRPVHGLARFGRGRWHRDAVG